MSGLCEIAFRQRCDGEAGYVITEIWISSAATSPNATSMCAEYDPDSPGTGAYWNYNLKDTATHLALLNAGDTV